MTDNLIYLNARSPEHKYMMKYCVMSLRGSGNYKDKIIIFTDEIDENLKSISHLADIVVLKIKDDPLSARIFVMEYINPSPYNNIMCLDSDIIAFNDINPLFRAKNELLYYEEPWHFNKNSWSNLIDTYYFTEEERLITYGNFHPINCGHFCVDANYFISFYEAYKDVYCSKSKYEYGMDQSSFNAMIRRGKVKSQPFQQNEICIADKTPEIIWKNYKLVHFAGYAGRKEKMKKVCPSHFALL